MEAILSRTQCVNFLAPGRCSSNFSSIISEHMLWVEFKSTFGKIPIRQMPLNSFDDKSTLI